MKGLDRLYSKNFNDFINIPRLYRAQILLLGGFAGWLWSFPLYGPVLAAAGVRYGAADVSPVFFSFLALHGVGLAAAGSLLAGWGGPGGRLFSVTAAACALLTAAFALASPRLWPYLGGLLGVAAAPFLVAWGRRLATDVEPAHRGRVMALSLFVGVLLNAVQMFVAGKAPAAGLLVSPLLLLLPVFLALNPLKPAPATRQKVDSAPGASRSPTAWLNKWWRFALLVFVFYLTGGLMYQVVQPAIGQDIPYSPYLGTFSYGMAGLAAGTLADRRGRRFLPLAGLGLVGASFALFALWPGIPAHILIQVIIQAGYACLDLFVFLYLADRAAGDPARASRYYGWGFCLNVLSVLAGNAAGGLLQAALPAEHPVKASLLASLALFTAFPFLAGMREPLAAAGPAVPEHPACPGFFSASEPSGGAPSPTCPSGPEPAFCPAPPCTAGYAQDMGCQRDDELKQVRFHLLDNGFTPREIEVALLVLEGLDNAAIALRLNISKNTLKTHFRNIYKKARASSRISFILWVQDVTKNHLFG